VSILFPDDSWARGRGRGRVHRRGRGPAPCRTSPSPAGTPPGLRSQEGFPRGDPVSAFARVALLPREPRLAARGTDSFDGQPQLAARGTGSLPRGTPAEPSAKLPSALGNPSFGASRASLSDLTPANPLG